MNLFLESMLFYPENKRGKKVLNPIFGKGLKEDLEAFLQLCKFWKSDFDREKIEKAFYWNFRANENKLRKSGEPFYTHSLEVAKIVINEIVYDDIMVTVALLHNVLGRTKGFSIEDVRAEFGETTAKILEGVDKITHLERQPYENPDYLRRIILSLFTDIRIILVKIADRLHDMQTIEFLEPQRQIQLAESTTSIYVPFAHRFGLGLIKGELEDLAFRVLEPEKYELVLQEFKENREQYENLLFIYAKSITERLKNADYLIDNEVNFEVHGRVKHIYSTYKKSLLRNKPIRELYDIIAIRIVLDTEDISYCYKIYEETISLGYKLVPGTYKDYIKNPKPNGYQSLHCAFFGVGGNMFEMQIRTRKMHETAERGFAAHYHYKNDFVPIDSILSNPDVDQWISTIRGKMAKIVELSLEELLDGFPSEAILNNIYVFTPENEIKILPVNSTAMDFAYHIHTDVGNRCIAVKVNGKTQPFDYTLHSGDKVEIITSSKAEPKPEWLSFVQTSKAKNAIESYLRAKEKQIINEGTKILNSFLNRYHIGSSLEKFEESLRSIFPNDRMEEFYKLLGKNSEFKELFESALKFISKNPAILEKNLYRHLEQSKELRNLYDFFHNQKLINGTYITSIRDCCFPIPNENAIGIIIENHIFIHRADCHSISNKIGKLNTFNVDWRFVRYDKFKIGFQISGVSTTKVIEGLKFILGLESANTYTRTLNVSIEKIQVQQRENNELSEPFVINVLFNVDSAEINLFMDKITKAQQQFLQIERLPVTKSNYFYYSSKTTSGEK